MTAPQNQHDQAFPVNGHDSTDTASWPTPGRPAAKRSRMGGLWVAAVVFAFVLLVLLIFVLQNGQRAEVSFLGAHGHLPMGVALLLAAVFGILLVALPGTARIVQLRMLDRRPAGHAERWPMPGSPLLDGDRHDPRDDAAPCAPPGRMSHVHHATRHDDPPVTALTPSAVPRPRPGPGGPRRGMVAAFLGPAGRTPRPCPRPVRTLWADPATRA